MRTGDVFVGEYVDARRARTGSAAMAPREIRAERDLGGGKVVRMGCTMTGDIAAEVIMKPSDRPFVVIRNIANTTGLGWHTMQLWPNEAVDEIAAMVRLMTLP